MPRRPPARVPPTTARPAPADARAAAIRARLRALADPKAAAIVSAYFKCTPGGYGEGDTFLGIKAPPLRALAKACDGAAEADLLELLQSAVHEERALALMMLVRRFERADELGRRAIYRLYLKHTRFINNWDLVDASAPGIVGAYLHARGRSPRVALAKLAKSPRLWERRMAMVATLWFIRAGELGPTFEVAGVLLGDTHDLIHKGLGWMLREAGKRDSGALTDFLRLHYARLPRTALRYAIERFPADRRRRFLLGQFA